MKVAYLLGSLNRGGAETLMLDVFRNAKKAPFNVIGVHRKGGAYKDAFYAAGPKMYQLSPKRYGYFRYLIKLRKLFKVESVSIIHTQHWLDCIYAWIATIGMNIRIINTFHGFYSMNGINGLLCRLSIRIADDVCFVSKYEQDWYQSQMRIPDVKCHVVYNGIDFVKIDSVLPTLEYANKKQRIQLAMVGNFVNGRSQNIIVRSIHILRKRGIRDFDFNFIGRKVDVQEACYNECLQYCEENNLDNVYFLGGRGDVPALLKVMDGFVYSSVHDTFGIAVVEAMAAGLPVVVNDYEVMKEVCGNLVTYFKSNDPENCANMIEKLLIELPQRKETAKKNANLIRRQYSIDTYIDRLYQIYNFKK